MLHLKTRYRPQKPRAILSLLLAFVFVAISGVQILHEHDHASFTDDVDHTECVYPTEKCVICDYIAHQQAHPAQLACLSAVLIPVPEAITLQHKIFTGVYTSTSHGFTNKAPPFIAS